MENVGYVPARIFQVRQLIAAENEGAENVRVKKKCAQRR